MWYMVLYHLHNWVTMHFVLKQYVSVLNIIFAITYFTILLNYSTLFINKLQYVKITNLFIKLFQFLHIIVDDSIVQNKINNKNKNAIDVAVYTFAFNATLLIYKMY